MLKQRRFLPFFVVQFLGALNDNLFKNALVALVGFRIASETQSGLLTNLAAALFILPFFGFSPVAGQIADIFDKAKLMRVVKVAEIAIMALGAFGFYIDNIPLLFTTLFLMGTHSAFFGPVKYSILPCHLQDSELMAGNALVEMGTNLAILVGMIGGLLFGGSSDITAISTSILAVAALGFTLSLFIPPAPPTVKNLKLDWNPFRQTLVLTRIVKAKEAVFNSIMGISWSWYFGATLLTQLLNFTKHILHGNQEVLTLLMATLTIAIGVGSILCEKLSRGEIELGIVPLGSLGMTVFTADLYFIDYPNVTGPLQSIHELLSGPAYASTVHALIDLGLLGVFFGFFIVPLYALIQYRSDPDSRSRVIAANNVYNAVFMVVSALVTMGLYSLHFNTIEILLYTAILNAVVACYIFFLIPEFILRFGIWILANTIYRLRYVGRDQLPRQGAALIVANHVSFIDWFIITAACRRPVRFIMDAGYFKMPGLGWLFKAAKAIPIASAKTDPALKEQAFARIQAELKDGNVVCIFPEGAITRSGHMEAFRPGVERILKEHPVPVYPLALAGLWGSFFSRAKGHAMSGMPRPSRRVIEVRIGESLPSTATAAALEAAVAKLLGPGDHSSPGVKP